MHFLDAEIFSEVLKLSMPSLVVLFCCGFFLWSAGYLTHKFWVVFLATASAGILGFDKGPDFGIQGVFAALLFGISVVFWRFPSFVLLFLLLVALRDCCLLML